MHQEGHIVGVRLILTFQPPCNLLFGEAGHRANLIYVAVEICVNQVLDDIVPIDHTAPYRCSP
jgi:hypothetical protein